jgi:hypothetical protein
MDTKTLVTEKMKELKPLYDRFDIDAKLAHLNKFTLTYIDEEGNEHPISGRVSVTMNEPAVYLNTVQSWLLARKEQTHIEGDIADDQKTKIEHFINDAFASADDMRFLNGEGKLDWYWSLHIAARGWIADRIVWKDKGNGEVYPEILSADVRGLQWQYDKNGLVWVNNQTFRSPSDVVNEYGEDALSKSKGQVRYGIFGMAKRTRYG